jgi:anti-sigma B factor antagonist
MENQPRKLVVPTAKLDNAAARQLLRAAELAFKEGVRDLVIDLGAVRFMDSLGISALVTVLRRAPAGGRVVLASMTPYAQTLARLTHLDDVFDIFADADAAMASFAQPASPTRALGV